MARVVLVLSSPGDQGLGTISVKAREKQPVIQSRAHYTLCLSCGAAHLLGPQHVPKGKPFGQTSRVTGLPWRLPGESACNAGDPGLIPGSGRSPEKEMASHSSALAWRIPWTEEPGGLQSMGSQSRSRLSD